MLSLQAAVAQFAVEFESPQMHGQMLRQVRLLREALVAAGLLAYKGSLSRVHSKVVEEVVPLAEKHLAVGKVTLQNLHLSLCSGILVLQNTEQPQPKNGIVYSIIGRSTTCLMLDYEGKNICIIPFNEK